MTPSQEAHIDKLHEEVLLLQLCNSVQRIQEILHKNHTQLNCDCVDTIDTALMKSGESANIEICLQCFGTVVC